MPRDDSAAEDRIERAGGTSDSSGDRRRRRMAREPKPSEEDLRACVDKFMAALVNLSGRDDV
eukprot:8436178-Alexandrium_andersonii.AAC.1